MNKHWLLIILLLSSNSFADQFLCSTNMQYVYTGDTMNSVIAACGPPDQVVNQAAQAQSQSGNGNLIWYYQTAAANQAGVSNNGFTASAGALAATAPTVTVGPRQVNITTSRPPDINLGIVFNNGQVASIQQSGSTNKLGLGANANQGLTSYTCPNGPVQIGSSMNDVAAACGLPVFQKTLAQSQQSPGTAATGPATLLIYKPQPYLPAQTFIFNNGILVGQR